MGRITPRGAWRAGCVLVCMLCTGCASPRGPQFGPDLLEIEASFAQGAATQVWSIHVRSFADASGGELRFEAFLDGSRAELRGAVLLDRQRMATLNAVLDRQRFGELPTSLGPTFSVPHQPSFILKACRAKAVSRGPGGRPRQRKRLA